MRKGTDHTRGTEERHKGEELRITEETHGGEALSTLRRGEAFCTLRALGRDSEERLTLRALRESTGDTEEGLQRGTGGAETTPPPLPPKGKIFQGTRRSPHQRTKHIQKTNTFQSTRVFPHSNK